VSTQISAVRVDPAAVGTGQELARRRRAARYATALALAVTSVVHIPVAVEHLDQVPYLGGLFYAFVIATAAGAGSLLVESRKLVWQAMGLLTFAATAVFVVSRIFGLPGASDDRGDWNNAAALTCVVAQAAVVTLSLVVLRSWSGVCDR